MRHSFHRAPGRRWRRALELVGSGRYYKPRRDDEATGRAARYLRAGARCRGGASRARVMRDYGDAHAARRLHESGGQARLLVEARILARQPTGEVSRLTSVPPEVVDTHEGLFFNCRDRLDARDWVTVHALGRRVFSGQAAPDPGVVLKSFAYFGGPYAADNLRREDAVNRHVEHDYDALGTDP